jgi:iron complex outermembrane recepter protein
MTTNAQKLRLSVSLVAMLANAGTAFAEDAVAKTGGLEDIVVTARKTEEKLSTAPVAVSAFSEKKISQLGLTNVDDLAKQSTGISFSQAFGRSSDRPVIRGQSNVLARVQAGVESGTAYFIDGSYYNGDIQGLDFDSLARVEVVKGPQSALYGRNTYAGAINFITKDPTSEFSGSIKATAAQYGEYAVSGSVSAPLIGDKLGIRVGGKFSKYGGQYINQLTGKKVGQEQTASGYVLLNAKPTDDISIRLRGAYQHDIDGSPALFLQGAAENNCKPGFRSPAFRTFSPFLPNIPATLRSTNNNQFFCGVIQAKPDGIRLNTEALANGTPDGTAFDGYENFEKNFSSVINWDIGGSGFVLSSLTSYRDDKNLFGTDSDHSEAYFFFGARVGEPAFANTSRTKQTDFSQEVRFSTPADGRIRVSVGGYYYKQKFENVDLTFANPRGGEILGSAASSASTIRDIAAFGAATLKVTDQLSISGEIRYSEEEKQSIDPGNTGFCAGYETLAATFGRTLTTNPCRPAGKWTGTDPRITIDYKTDNGTLFYAVYATGRKPGGFNGSAGVVANRATYDPEKVKSLEIGTKFSGLNDRVRITAAIFSSELTNIQATTAIVDPVNPSRALTSIVTNNGDGRSRGLEIDFQAAPTENLQLNIGYAYVDAKFTRGCDADQFILNSGGFRIPDTLNPGANLAACSIAGNRLPLGSPHIFNGSANWQTDAVSGGDIKLFVNTSFSYESSKFVQVDNLAKTGDTFLLSSRIGLRSDKWSFTIFGRNLTNEQSIPLATRWFDYRYGGGRTTATQPASGLYNGQNLATETGAPRGFFGSLRKGRTIGIEGTFNF